MKTLNFLCPLNHWAIFIKCCIHFRRNVRPYGTFVCVYVCVWVHGHGKQGQNQDVKSTDVQAGTVYLLLLPYSVCNLRWFLHPLIQLTHLRPHHQFEFVYIQLALHFVPVVSHVCGMEGREREWKWNYGKLSWEKKNDCIPSFLTGDN
jgi:hypothetical protein